MKTLTSLDRICRIIRHGALAAVMFAGFTWCGVQSAQADPFLDEMVEFNGAVFYLEHKVPALVIGVAHNGKMPVRGFGERTGKGSQAPDGDTVMRKGEDTQTQLPHDRLASPSPREIAP